jgi:hypothetical protein
MSTYSTSHRVNGSSHPLDGRLGGYYRGLVHRVPRLPVTAQKFGYNRFPPATNDWGIKHLVPDMALPLLAE